MFDNYMPEEYFTEPGYNMMPQMPCLPEWPQNPEMYCPPAGPCIPQEMVINNVHLARAYVPFQKLCDTYSPIEGFIQGTIFPELFSPYMGRDKKCF